MDFNEVRYVVEDEVETESHHENLLRVYVDTKLLERTKDILSHRENTKKYITMYEINGSVFEDTKDLLAVKGDEYLKFEIKQHAAHTDDGDQEGTETVSKSDGGIDLKEMISQQLFNDDTSLRVSVETTEYGIIINSSVLLTDKSWNTVIYSNEPECFVCDMDLKNRNIGEHIATDDHKSKLDACKPLNKFDINIIRQINGKYHCGICNIVFDDSRHLEEDVHGQKIMASINRVSDILCDFNDKINKSSNRVNENMFHDENERVFDGGFNTRNFDYGTENLEDEQQQNALTDQPCVSYAEMVKKAANEFPEYVYFDLGDRQAKVQLDCWHMMVNQKTTNTFYCMACAYTDAMRHISDHRTSVTHVENLKKCTIVKDYKNHVVRRYNNKLYHCGHCNNLQLYNDMQQHLDTVHPSRSTPKATPGTTPRPTPCATPLVTPSAIPRTTPSATLQATTRGNPSANTSDRGCTNCADCETAGTNTNTQKAFVVSNSPSILYANFGVINESRPRIPTESDTLVIHVFGQMFKVSLLSFHFVERYPREYLCWLCQVAVDYHIIWYHMVHDGRHVKALRETLFCPMYNIHLIRKIQSFFHCLLCQAFIRDNPENHLKEPKHLIYLNMSRGVLQRNVCHPMLGQTVLPQNISTIPDMAQEANREDKVTLENNENNAKKSYNDDVTKDKNTADEIYNENDGKDHNNGESTDKDIIGAIRETIFDPEDFVYVKLENRSTKITLASYNTLIQLGTGTRYCFFCSTEMNDDKLKDHVNTKNHQKYIAENKFLEIHKKHLLRQNSSLYHCGICNVSIRQNFLAEHLSWPPHVEIEASKITKIIRKKEIQASAKEIVCSTQNHKTFTNEAGVFKVMFNIVYAWNVRKKVVKKNVIVCLNNKVLKITWDAYQGINKYKKKYKCLVCNIVIQLYELECHVEDSRHYQMLDNCFLLDYAPELIRKVAGKMVQCLTCNVAFSGENHVVEGHLKGKRHKQCANLTVEASSGDDQNCHILTLNTEKYSSNQER